MGKIIADIATTDQKIRSEAILHNLLPGRNHLVICHRCGQKTTTALIKVHNKGEIHIILYPCTRVVLGIHPETHAAVEKQFGKNISFDTGDSYFFCQECVGWALPEQVAKSVPEIQEGIIKKRDPIHDSGKPFKKELGCWITLTEFPLTQIGRFFDYQTDFKNFVRILAEAKIVNRALLTPFL